VGSLSDVLAPIVAAACALTLSPCATERSQSTFRPYASGFSSITYVAANRAEPRRLYVVEQDGRIRYLVDGRLAGTFLDIRDRVSSGGERGLLSMVFHPRYAKNHRFYVNYTDRTGDTRVVEFRSRGGKAVRSSARQLLFVKQPYPNHNGGQLEFGPDGQLYVGMGDGGSGGDPENRAQNLRARLGKLLKANGTARRPSWRIVGYGLRNPWRFSFDQANGDLYIADVGQGSWEEIDYRPRARLGALANYGWNLYEGRARFRSGNPNTAGDLVFPVHVYSHAANACTVVGGYVYRGRAVSAAAGRYFFGDYCNGAVWSVRMSGGRATDLRRESVTIDQLQTFGQDVRGELYAGTGDGRILKLAS
jgi:glucose/arabinose dehydrogenase